VLGGFLFYPRRESPSNPWNRQYLRPIPPRSLHQVHDEEKGFEMELAWICDESGREFKRVPQVCVCVCMFFWGQRAVNGLFWGIRKARCMPG
jgi:hypothetical protein